MTSPPASGASAGPGTLALITIGIFGIVTSTTMLGPLLLDLSRDFGVSLGQAGLLATVMAVPWALGSPFAGVMSDRLGRRPLIVLAYGGVGAMYLVSAGVRSFALLVAVRFVTGALGSCGPPVLLAATGELFPPERRARAMGWFNMGFSLAAVAGVPLVAMIAGLWGWRASFVAVGGALIALSGVFRLAFPSPRRSTAATSALAAYREVFAVSQLVNVMAANVVERSMFTMMTLYLPPFFMLTYHLGAVEVAPLLAMVAVGAIGGNVLGGWLGDRFWRPGVFIASQALAATFALALFGLRLPLAVAIGLAAVFGLAASLGRPAFLAFSSELAPEHRGALFGLIGLTNQGGLVVGSAVGGFILEMGGFVTLAVIAAAQALGAAGLAVPLRHRRGSGALAA
jgi:DHA1 family inner membrane transport protein